MFFTEGFVATGSVAGARLVFTDRLGGVSAPPYDTLNLGAQVGDHPADVEQNRRLLAAALGLPADRLTLMSQVHGADVAQVDGQPTEPTTDATSGARRRPVADAMVTTTRGLALVVLIADCTPVLLAATEPDVVAAAHAGRRGVQAGVIAEVVAAMRRAGARTDRIAARVGPAICGRCYEVSPDVQAEVVRAAPAARSTTRAGTPGLDIRAAVVAQLATAGVSSVEVEPGCTAESADLYSYRRDGVTGRFAGLVWLPERSSDG